jgi:hypothetical protein
MLRPFLLIFLFIFSTQLFGQKYYTKDILKKADSIIISVVGQNVFYNHFQLDSTSYYETKTAFNNDKIKYLTTTKNTNGKIKLIAVRYTFYLKKYEQPSVSTSLLFDKELYLKEPIDTTFIPKFILHETASNFLTKEDILKTAKDKFIKKGIKPIESSLTYDYNKKLYVWTVTNILNEWKGYNDEISREVELLEINASNGQIITFYPNALQAPIH